MRFRYGQWVRFKRGKSSSTKRRYKTASDSRLITTANGRRVEAVRLHNNHNGWYSVANLEACL